MILQPRAILQVATAANATGIMTQPAHVNTDTFSTLSAVTGLEKSGLFFERNTGNLMGLPVPIYEDLSLTSGTPWTTSGGKWKNVTDRTTTTLSLSQYDGTAGVSYTATSPANFLTGNDAFSLKLNIGPCPKAGTHDRENYYRRVVFPANSPAGYTRYRFTLNYGEAPRLEYSTDQGVTWKVIGNIPSPVDLSLLRHGQNVQFTLSFLQIDSTTLVWIGDLDRYTLYARQDGVDIGASLAGTLQLEGSNGLFQASFARLRFTANATYHSYDMPGPRDMSATPQFVVQPDNRGTAGVSVTGVIETRDKSLNRFTYGLTLASTPLSAPNQAYSATTPLVKSCTVVWPPIYNPPPSAGWVDVLGINRITEHQSFDLFGSGMLCRSLEVDLDNNLGQRRLTGGVQAAQLFFGYGHAGMFLRGRYLANVRANWTAEGARSRMVLEGEDLLFQLKMQPLRDDIYPSQWCIYTLARLLLQHGGVVPDLQRLIPACDYGPNPSHCPHTKFVAHPGFKTPRMVLDCLGEMRPVIGAWMGQDYTGQFRFEPFDWSPTRFPAKQFQEVSGFDFGQPGGSVNDILPGLIRGRALDDVRNDLNVIGFDQTTGGIFLSHLDTVDTIRSKYDPSSPNYLGFTAPLIHEHSMYSTEAFADYALGQMAQFVPLPRESVTLPCHGQPNLYPGDIIEVNDRRTVGRGVRYWLTDVISTWESGRYFSTLIGQWIGIGTPPGGY